MPRWQEPLETFDNAGPYSAGVAEGAVVDLREYADRHAMKWYLSASSGPTPAYTLRLEGEWEEGRGWVMLAEVDQIAAPPATHRMLVVEGKPCRRLRAVLTVTVGAVSPDVSITSEA